MFHRPRDEESANAKNLQNIIPHTGYGAVNLETRETVCCCVRAGAMHREQESAMSPLSLRAVTARCRHQSCEPWFHSNTSTEQAARNSWPNGRRNVKKDTESQCRNSRHQGRRNVIAVADCRCHYSWHKGRRNVLRDKEPKSTNTEIATTKLHDIVQKCPCSSCDVRGWPGRAI